MKGKNMTFLTTSKHEFNGYKIVEHIAIIQHRMVFTDEEGIELPDDFDELPEIDIIENDKEYLLEKELVKEELIQEAKRDGANAIIGLKFSICTVLDKFLVVYGNGSSVRIEPEDLNYNKHSIKYSI